MKAARLLRQARRRVGMSQRDLARVTGMPQPAIARIERGAVTPGIDTLERLLAGVGMTLEVVPRPGIGVDRTLVREALRKTPEERILAAGRAGRALRAWRREVDGVGFPRWVGVVCEDLEGQRHFYRDVMGIRVAEEGDGWVKFDMGPGVSFELLRRSTDPQYDRARYQVGFAVEDIEAARRELVAAGVTPISDIMGTPDDPMRWAYFKDPEGNVFEITERSDEP